MLLKKGFFLKCKASFFIRKVRRKFFTIFIKIKIILYKKNNNLYLKIKFKKYLIFFIQNKNYVKLTGISVNYYNTL